MGVEKVRYQTSSITLLKTVTCQNQGFFVIIDKPKSKRKYIISFTTYKDIKILNTFISKISFTNTEKNILNFLHTHKFRWLFYNENLVLNVRISDVQIQVIIKIRSKVNIYIRT